MFDRVEITVKSGRGGDGIVSFRREKYVPFGGPNGGDGGDGGSVIIRADPSVTSLAAFRSKGVYRARKGESGHGQKKHGHNGDDLELMVPVGTVIWDKDRADEGEPAFDLDIPGGEVVLVRGGKGGQGNTHFATSINQAPRIIQNGEAEETLDLILEMRLIADVGIIGYPNVGKSTLVAAISAATPKVASYPFTTLEPVLGAVELEGRNVIFAEVPGLIDGAHLGRGLGHDFLRHVMRTRVLIHLLDGTSAVPREDMQRLGQELTLYDATLSWKPQVVVVNKVDLPQVRARIGEIEGELAAAGKPAVFISAATGEGLPALLASVVKLLKREPVVEERPREEVAEKVFHPEPSRDNLASFRKEGDIFVVDVPGLERIVIGPGGRVEEVVELFRQRLSRSGLSRALKRGGIKPGDKIRLGSVEWEWP